MNLDATILAFEAFLQFFSVSHKANNIVSKTSCQLLGIIHFSHLTNEFCKPSLCVHKIKLCKFQIADFLFCRFNCMHGNPKYELITIFPFVRKFQGSVNAYSSNYPRYGIFRNIVAIYSPHPLRFGKFSVQLSSLLHKTKCSGSLLGIRSYLHFSPMIFRHHLKYSNPFYSENLTKDTPKKNTFDVCKN